MGDRRIIALKVQGFGESVLASLEAGEGRFGWSYVETANLLDLRTRIEAHGWASLTDDEQNCYQHFLFDLEPGDYVVFINVPSYRRCTLARVTGGYFWRYDDEDFNHRFTVDAASVRSFDRNASIVHPALSARLKLQGRWWRVSTVDEFHDLRRALEAGAPSTPFTPDDQLNLVARSLKPLFGKMTQAIQHAAPNYQLEKLLGKVFERIPAVTEAKVQGGAGDHGADLVVSYEHRHPLTGAVEPRRCAIQVKSFVGEHGDLTAIEDIERAFEHDPDLSEGIIVSTADRASVAFEQALEELNRKSRRPVYLILGEQVSALILRHALDLFAPTVADGSLP